MADILTSLNKLEELLKSAIQEKHRVRTALIKWAWQVHGDGGNVPNYVWDEILPPGVAKPPTPKGIDERCTSG